jgi:hypothetical protein
MAEDRQWYQLKMSLYLTDEQASILGQNWTTAFMKIMQRVLPTPPRFYIDDPSLILEEE